MYKYIESLALREKGFKRGVGFIGNWYHGHVYYRRILLVIFIFLSFLSLVAQKARRREQE
jgi:hypothetical protein